MTSTSPEPETNLGRLRRWVNAYELDGFEGAGRLIDELFDQRVEMTATGRASVPIGQELATVYEFENGLIRRMTAYGSLQEALDMAAKVQHA